MKKLRAEFNDESSYTESITKPLEQPSGGLPLPLLTPLSIELKEQGNTIARQCAQADNVTGHSNFHRLQSFVNLAIWLCKANQTFGTQFSPILAYQELGIDHDIVSKNQFVHWHKDGYVLLRLIYASSIYILPAVAVSSMNGLINHLLDQDRRKIENLLRDPFIEGPFPKSLCDLICLHIRKFHGYMRATNSQTGIILDGHRYGLDLEQDDLKINHLLSNRYAPADFGMIPRGAVWSDYHILPVLQTPPLVSTTKLIVTAFNPKHHKNRGLPKSLKENSVKWTTEQRQLAKEALRPSTMDDFETMIQNLLKRGWKKQNGYVRLPAQLVQETDLLLTGVADIEDDLICFRLSDDTITMENKEAIHLFIKDITRIQDQQIKSSERDENAPYDAWHIGCWNKRTWSASDLGLGKDETHDEYIAVKIAQVTQSRPYLDRSAILLSTDFSKDHFLYSALHDFHERLADALQPMVRKLNHHLPRLMERHQKLYTSLGPTYTFGCAPFCMTVLNIQPATRGHRDSSDMIDSVCIVMALGDFEGGELCLYESGLVIELPHGSCVAVRSKRDVHFNLDFEGQRFSFVFTSDKSLRHWDEERNCWEDLRRGVADMEVDLPIGQSSDEADSLSDSDYEVEDSFLEHDL